MLAASCLSLGICVVLRTSTEQLPTSINTARLQGPPLRTRIALSCKTCPASPCASRPQLSPAASWRFPRQVASPTEGHGRLPGPSLANVSLVSARPSATKGWPLGPRAPGRPPAESRGCSVCLGRPRPTSNTQILPCQPHGFEQHPQPPTRCLRHQPRHQPPTPPAQLPASTV
jgi:hypothetical protein